MDLLLSCETDLKVVESNGCPIGLRTAEFAIHIFKLMFGYFFVFVFQKLSLFWESKHTEGLKEACCLGR